MMARPKKDSVPLSILMKKELAEDLAKYCEKTRLTKTAAIEKAVEEMLDDSKRETRAS